MKRIALAFILLLPLVVLLILRASTEQEEPVEHDAPHSSMNSFYNVLPLQEWEARGFEKTAYRLLDGKLLRENAVHIKPVSDRGNASVEQSPVRIDLAQLSLYVIRNRAECPVGICSSHEIGKWGSLLVFADQQMRVVATIQSCVESPWGMAFSLHRFERNEMHETLIWTIQPGGADQAFEHFFIETTQNGRIRLITDFAPRVMEKYLEVRGNVEVVQSESTILKKSTMRGPLLTIPKQHEGKASFESVIQFSKSAHSKFSLGNAVLPKPERYGGGELVLMQLDSFSMNMMPPRTDRLVYLAIERKAGQWQDASRSEPAQAFYRAAADDLFRELSKEDGAIRNSLLGPWAFYKALLGEWDEAKEIIAVKADPVVFRNPLPMVKVLEAQLELHGFSNN